MRIILVLIILIIIFSFLNIDLRGFIDSEIVQSNLANLHEFLLAVGQFLTAIWSKIAQYF